MILLPVAAVIPTRNRPEALGRALDSLLQADYAIDQVIVIDASDDNSTRDAIARLAQRIPHTAWHWAAATKRGAAAQRNQGIALADKPYVWFMDDDVVLAPGCGRLLWQALEARTELGGASAMITNQKYHPPGFASSLIFALMNGRREASYAGKVLGPAVSLLPDDDDALPEVVPVEWLNTTCTMYRRIALPDPPFDSVFTGYSLMEDLTLSLRVAQGWQLANVRAAKVFHDSQPGPHKADVRERARMELVNRHYVMTQVLRRTRPGDYARLAVWELFQLATLAWGDRLGRAFWKSVAGKLRALRSIT